MLLEISEGYGLYEWKSGPEPTVGEVIVGDIAGGPPVDGTLKSSGEKISLEHWADAKNSDVLFKHTLRRCANEPKRK